MLTATPLEKTADFLTLSQAARIAGRSYSWARDRTIGGHLEQRRFSPGGVLHVTAESLSRLLELERKQAARPGSRAMRNRRSHLRLVIDNT